MPEGFLYLAVCFSHGINGTEKNTDEANKNIYSLLQSYRPEQKSPPGKKPDYNYYIEFLLKHGGEEVTPLIKKNSIAQINLAEANLVGRQMKRHEI